MLWIKSEKQLKDFLSELNQKYPPIKFDYKCDCKQIEFLDTLVYINEQNKLQTTLFQKSSDRENFLNAKSEHPYSLKKSITYSQALRIGQIYSTFQDYHSHSRKLIEKFVNKGYKNKMLSYSKFRKLTYSIEKNCSTNKSVMINNVYHYQEHIVERYQI